jgi:hypothetical protein
MPADLAWRLVPSALLVTTLFAAANWCVLCR